MSRNRDMKLVVDIVEKEGKQELVYKTYPYPIFVKGSITKQAIDLGAELEGIEENISSDVVDKMADFVVNVYNQAFTRDELIDGIQAHELMPKLSSVLQFVMGTGDESKSKQEKFIEAKKS